MQDRATNPHEGSQAIDGGMFQYQGKYESNNAGCCSLLSAHYIRTLRIAVGGFICARAVAGPFCSIGSACTGISTRKLLQGA